jgi:hypothetical protein
MEQIKSDVKTHKRIYSGDSELADGLTYLQHADMKCSNDNGRQTTSNRRKSRQGGARSSYVRTCISTRTTEADFTYLQDSRQVIITLTPPTITSSFNVIPQSPSQGNRVHQRRTTLNPPHPSIRLGPNDDLNRFVSSSTASGTTLTSGSVPSYVKHAGPAQIRTIAPSDLPALPERLGDMYFDRDLMKWVKGRAAAAAAEQSNSRGSEQSEDPFGDFESLQDDSRTEQPEYLSSPDTHNGLNAEAFLGMTMISEVEDEEEMELSNFSTDAPARVVQVLTDVELQEYEEETTDSESSNDDIHTATQAVINDIDFDSELEDSSCRNNLVGVADAGPSNIDREGHSSQRLTVVVTPTRGASATATPIIKSALKSNSATPTSALKNGTRTRFHTPKSNAHRRSVSFSDGKRDGPMRGPLCVIMGNLNF